MLLVVDKDLRRSLLRSRCNSISAHQTRPAPAHQNISANVVNEPARMTEIETMMTALIMNFPLFQMTLAPAAISIVQPLHPHGLTDIATIVKNRHHRLLRTPTPAPTHSLILPDRLPLHILTLPLTCLNDLTRRVGRFQRKETTLWQTPLRDCSVVVADLASS